MDLRRKTCLGRLSELKLKGILTGDKMTNDTYISDNQGNRVAVPGTANPIAASGQTLTDAATGADHTATVVAGAKYALTCDATGTMLLGILDSTTAANVIWAVPPSGDAIISIPLGVTTLHYNGTVNATTVYLRRLSDGTS
jgi:hypothetical protein